MLFNLIIGIVCGVAGGMNLAVGNIAVGLVNIILSFGNFFIGYILIKRKKEEERLVNMYNTNLEFRNYMNNVNDVITLKEKGVWYDGKTETEDPFGLRAGENWISLCNKQGKRSNSKQA